MKTWNKPKLIKVNFVPVNTKLMRKFIILEATVDKLISEEQIRNVCSRQKVVLMPYLPMSMN